MIEQMNEQTSEKKMNDGSINKFKQINKHVVFIINPLFYTCTLIVFILCK